MNVALSLTRAGCVFVTMLFPGAAVAQGPVAAGPGITLPFADDRRTLLGKIARGVNVPELHRVAGAGSLAVRFMVGADSRPIGGTFTPEKGFSGDAQALVAAVAAVEAAVMGAASDGLELPEGFLDGGARPVVFNIVSNPRSPQTQ